MLPIKNEKTQAVPSRTLYVQKVAENLMTLDDKGNGYDLIIILQQSNISFRALSDFLTIVDRFYGRFYKKGFLSYSMTESIHLQAEEIRHGSVEYVIEEILKKLSVNDTVYFYLMIKYLPVAIKYGTEIIKNSAEAFYNYEKAQSVRHERKTLKKELRSDLAIIGLNDVEINKLAKSMLGKYAKDKKLLKRATKFAAKKLIDVRLQKRNED